MQEKVLKLQWYIKLLKKLMAIQNKELDLESYIKEIQSKLDELSK